MVKRIIVPLDQSTISESALPLARGLAHRLSVPVSLITVVDAPSAFLRSRGVSQESAPASESAETRMDPYLPAGGGPSGSSISPTALEKLADTVSAGEQYLQGVGEGFPDVPVETNVSYGDPAERILAFTETRDDPVIVIATHGRSGLQRALLGSVTSRVVLASPFPIFVVRGSEANISTGEREIKRVLIPLDGSIFAEQGLNSVQQIFGQNNVDLILLRVVETQRARGAYEFPDTDEYVQSTRQEAEEYLEAAARRLRSQGHTVTCDLNEGRVAERVNASAHTFGVDLIAMATHGRTGLSRFMLGSVTEQVLHEADRPLLLVRPAELVEQTA